MRKLILFFFVFTIVFVLHSSLEAKKKKFYRVACLANVDRNPSVIEEKKFDKPNYYNDELITIIWVPLSSGLNFEIKNNSNSSMSIIWDESNFVDQRNESHKIMHAGVKYIDRSNSMPPSTIPPGVTKSDLIFPSDYVYYVSGKYGGWRQKDIFKKKIKGKPIYDQKTKEMVIPFTSESFKAFMVISVDNAKYQYGFSFKTAKIEKGKKLASLNILPASKLTETKSQPVVKTQVEIKEGMTVAEVEALLGKPLSSAKFGNKVKYKYKEWKITFVDGKVTEVDF